MSVFERNAVSFGPHEQINKYPFSHTERISDDFKDIQFVFERLASGWNSNANAGDDRLHISVVHHQHFPNIGALFGLAFFVSYSEPQPPFDLETSWWECLKANLSVLAIVTFKRLGGKNVTLLVFDSLDVGDSINEKFIEINKVHVSHSTLYSLLFSSPLNSSISISKIKYHVFKEKILWWTATRHQNPIENFKGYFRPLRFASFLGHIQFEFHKGLSELAGEKLGFPVEFVPINLISETRSLYGESPTVLDLVKEFNIDIAFICGITYATYSDTFIPLVAPVRVGRKYHGQAVYFSEVIVRADNKDNINSLDDLKGKIFGYNETTSYSGYVMMKNHIKEKYHTSLEEFFKENKATQSHANSIQQVLKGDITCAAIDSTVLEMEIIKKNLGNLKIVESIGPQSIGPLAATKSVSSELQTQLTDFFTSLDKSNPLFSENGFERLLAVDENYYKQIKQ